MAISTTNEKFALITYQQMWNTPLPISADGLDQADNQHLIAQYPGVLWLESIMKRATEGLLFGVY